MDTNNIEHPFVKFVSMWALIGVTSWSEFAAFLGALYSCVLLGEWLLKRVVKPIAAHYGCKWAQPMYNRRSTDSKE